MKLLSPKKLVRMAALSAFGAGLLFLTGCATNLESTVAPGVELDDIETIFVKKLPADERGVEKLIAEELVQMGYKASYGAELPDGQAYDALVEYQDKWMWDITMYMIELRVQILDPDNRFVMASGQSFRTSLVRKSPPEMVEEVLEEIFGEAE
jgi:hypothetical protein